MEAVDSIIVGAGLAGCHLAWQLRERGQRVRVFDNPAAPCASEVAAGALNPVTGKRLAKSWRVDLLLPAAVERYRRIGAQLGEVVYHPVPIRRFCLDDNEVSTYRMRIEEEDYPAFLGDYVQSGASLTTIVDLHGSFLIRGAGYVDLPRLLEGMRASLADAGEFSPEAFHHDQLRLTAGGVHYAGLAARRTIFCEGAQIRANPWFQWLQFRPVKGQILKVRSDHLHLPRQLVHHRKWLLSLGNGEYRIGSTYERSSASSAPDEAGREALLDACRGFIRDDPHFEVLEHQAGVRPCTRDTKPYLGCHPQHPQLFLLNGLGSKGALMAPWLAEHLAEHIVAGKNIDPEIDCRRYAQTATHAPR